MAAGKYDDAIQMMTGRKFAVAEGANLNVSDQWTNAHILRGQQNIEAKRYKDALADFQAAVEIPSNIPMESVSSGGRSAEIAYWTGVAYEGMGDREKAAQSWNKGVGTSDSGLSRRPGMGSDLLAGGAQSYYQALCLQKLGQDGKAKAMFQSLVKSGQQAIQEVSAGAGSTAGTGRRQQSPRARLAMAHYLAGLGYLGLDDKEKAKEELTQALETSPDLLGARTVLAALKQQ